MCRQAQTESAYVQTVRRRKVDMSRLSCVQNFSCVLRAFQGKYVQTIPQRAFNAKILVRPSPDHRAFMSRLSCVHQTETKLPAGVQCRSFKLKTESIPKLNNSRYLKFFLSEVHAHLCYNSRHCLFFAIVNKIQGVYLSVLRIKWTSNKIRLFFETHSRKLKTT